MSNNPTKQQANDHEREAFEQIAKEHNWHFEDDEDDALWLFFRDAWKAGRASTESSTHETKFVKAVKEAIDPARNRPPEYPVRRCAG